MAGNEQHPRAGNTGVQNTDGNRLRACVDWLQVTFREKEFQKIYALLNLRPEDFQEMERGMHGYRRQRRAGKIVLLYDGATEEMGIHLVMSGQACRDFEARYPYSWGHFLWGILLEGGKITRMDAAIDDFHGYFTLRQVDGKVRRGETSSRFKHVRTIERLRVSDGENAGWTIYFGSEQSAVQVRIYDKLKERQAKGHEIEDGVKHWVRTEIQMRDQEAMSFARHVVKKYINCGVARVGNEIIYIGDTLRGVLANYIVFHKKKNDENKSRWPLCDWWKKFLGDVEKLRLSEVAPDRTIEETMSWLEKQTARSMAKVYMATGGTGDFVRNLIQQGMGKLSRMDEFEIEEYERRKAANENRYTDAGNDVADSVVVSDPLGFPGGGGDGDWTSNQRGD